MHIEPLKNLGNKASSITSKVHVCLEVCLSVLLLRLPCSDHYTGLSDSWCTAPIYCSPVTATLATLLAGVPEQWLRPLAVGKAHVIEGKAGQHCKGVGVGGSEPRHASPRWQPADTQLSADVHSSNTGSPSCSTSHASRLLQDASLNMFTGVEVVLVDANHCPGAVQILFKTPDGRRYVHCGDMRYCAAMQADPWLKQWRGASAVYLDTTYAKPKYTFCLQAEAVDYVVDTIRRLEALPDEAQEEDEDAADEGVDDDAAEAVGPEHAGRGQQEARAAAAVGSGGVAALGVKQGTARQGEATCTADAGTMDGSDGLAAADDEPDADADADAIGVDVPSIAEEGPTSVTSPEPAAAPVAAPKGALLFSEADMQVHATPLDPTPGVASSDGISGDSAATGSEQANATLSTQRHGHKRLYLISTYVIGKERILLAVHERLGLRICVTARKLAVLRATGISQDVLEAAFTTDPRVTPVHVTSWGFLGEVRAGGLQVQVLLPIPVTLLSHYAWASPLD